MIMRCTSLVLSPISLRLGVAHVTFHRKVGYVAVAAVDLDRFDGVHIAVSEACSFAIAA